MALENTLTPEAFKFDKMPDTSLISVGSIRGAMAAQKINPDLKGFGDVLAQMPLKETVNKAITSGLEHVAALKSHETGALSV